MVTNLFSLRDKFDLFEFINLNFIPDEEIQTNFILSDGNTVDLENVVIEEVTTHKYDSLEFEGIPNNGTFVAELESGSEKSVSLNKPSTPLMPNFLVGSKIKTINFGKSGSYSFNMNVK